MKKLIWLLALPLALVILYLAGPKVSTPHFNKALKAPVNTLKKIPAYLAQREAKFELRPNNEARVVWAADTQKTNVVFLYIHGFSASQGEGDPFHKTIAQRYNANLYLARLAGHGYQKNNLSNYTASTGWESAKEALALASQLGDTLVIMSTSTGCTYALMLAQYFPDKVYGLINLSPNVRVKSGAAFLLNNPWGQQIANKVIGPVRRVEYEHPAYPQYWDTAYTTKAVVELQSLLETTMLEENFEQINSPTLNCFYYQDEENQDQVVSVEAIRWMHENLGTPTEQKVLAPLAEPKNHVLGSPIKSKNVAVVIKAAQDFCDNTLGLQLTKK